ncbi:uncharacterized protein LOC124496639 isoform X1 [Dermatophagoides farinae]|uniref:uncharacterized protein LOC124496639 isoform X1 n=1 Tax=Dermatophagoides farinae TaxID=6954 RepID=UPI003F5F4251
MVSFFGRNGVFFQKKSCHFFHIFILSIITIMESSSLVLKQINFLPNNQNQNVSIAWKNLRYEVNTRFIGVGGRKVILKRLNGHLEYNSLNGFLGPSGAGKTTLLNCLNGKYQSGLSADSEIYINRRENDKPRIRYIQQHVHETIIGSMTVRQVLYYAFRFNNSYKHGRSEMDKQMTNVLDQLLLDHKVLDRRFDLCSGGEQKRIALAQELMSLKAPTFLFVDEPTTGLDSHAALLMVRCLRKLADNPQNQMTILASIHSPNSDILKLFDKLYILAKGGVCIYSGLPTLLRQNLHEHIGLVHDQSKPPIEEYLAIACKGIDYENVHLLVEATWSQQQTELKQVIPQMKFLPQGIIADHKLFSAGDFLLQITRMFQLTFIKQIDFRIITLIMMTLMFFIETNIYDSDMVTPNTCVLAADFSKSYGKQNQTCLEKIKDDYRVEFYLNFQCLFIMMLGYLLSGISSLTLSSLMKIFKNEHQNGWYSVGVSYWSIVIVRLIDFTIIALYVTTLMYFLIDHRYVDNGQFNSHRFTSFFLFLWMFIVYIQSMGQLWSLIFASLSDIAVAISLIVYASIDFNNGYIFPYNHIVMMTSKIISDLIGSRIIKNGLIYSFYGIDRCDTEEISSVLIGHDIDPDTVYVDLYRIVINSIILRLLTLILMMFKLQGLRCNHHHHWFVLRKKQSPSLDFIPIDYDDLNNNHHESFNVNVEIANDDDQRRKSAVEIEFDKFAKNRIIIAWRSLSLFNSGSIFELRSANDLEQPKYILRNLNGQFRFGTLNALMGTSGAGKTSFLKVLNGRDKTRLCSETKFYLSKFTPLRTCYITQEISCHLTQGLTALQCLIYASRLKNLDENIDHKQKAMALLEELDIADTANTLVNKCSGGQRKRLALALELMSLRMPNFICIDEPTSGLDSNSAEVIVTCLRKMSHKHNITIVAAIHQPNTEMLMLFDQVYILARGGVCIFSGPPSQISDHLQQVCNDENGDGDDKFAVEEMMKYSSLNHLEQQIKTLVQATNESILENQSDDQLLTDTRYILDGPQMNRTRFSLQSIRILIKRQLYFYIGSLMARFLILAVTIFAILNGLIIKSLIDPDIAYRNGCISLDEDLLNCNRSIDESLELYISFQYMMYCLDNFGIICFIFFAMIFTSQRKLFQIEHRNGWYSSGTFYVAKAISGCS